MNSKSLSILTLSITATLLLIAQFLPLQPAYGADSIKDRDFQLATTRAGQGGENVFVVDNRSGQVAVFSWDPSTKSLRLRSVGAMADAFR